MTNMTKDYYKILELTELCTDKDIKAAYRRLARKWHPDIAGNTEEAVKKFKELNEAYQTLSDRLQRYTYDTARKYYNYSSTKKAQTTENNKTTTNPNPNPNPQSAKESKENTKQNNSNFNFNWEELLSKYKKFTNKECKKNTSNQPLPKRGRDINTDVEITISEAINGTTKVVNMLHTCVCPKCGGRKFVNGSICTRCSGNGEVSDYKRFSVKIPSGIKDKSKIRLAGEGEKGLNGGANGDLYITVHIKAPLDYTTEGLNILKTVYITPYEAILGGNISVKTTDGNVTVKITPCTQSGQKIRLAGCGLSSNGNRGDMILTVEIQIPKTVSKEEVELYEKLKNISDKYVNK